jgi:hypothetical protein
MNGYSDGAVAWAVNGGLTFALDSLGAGDKAFIAVAYGAPIFAAGNIGFSGDSYNGAWFNWDHEVLSITGSFKHYFAPNLSSAISVNYASGERTFGYHPNDATFWGVNWNVQYAPVKNLYITPELRWTHYTGEHTYAPTFEEDDWTAMLRLERDFP